MGKINVAELLKGCPSGMELDCTMYENVYFSQIYENENCLYSIGCYTIVDGIRTSINFTKFGEFNTHRNSKCVIYPKGKTTWEGFQIPFKDGDIITCTNSGCTFISIFKKKNKRNKTFVRYCALILDDNNLKVDISWSDFCNPRFATEEEKEKLFQAIKDNGYKWNPETKTLEKLPKFKIGDRVRSKNTPSLIVTINSVNESSCYYGCSNDSWIVDQDNWELVPDKFDINTLEKLVEQKFKDGDILYIYSANPWICIYKEGGEKENVYYKYVAITSSSFVYDCSPLCHRNNVKEIRHATEEEKQKIFKAIKDNGYKWNPETKILEILPKFKVGDTITNGKTSITIGYIDNEYYYEISRNIANRLFIKNQDEWDLISEKFPNRFNINTLVPFESKVLVRNDEQQYWIPAFWGCKRFDGYTTTFGWCKYCIPYEGNEHLLETNNDCNDFYKTWK